MIVLLSKQQLVVDGKDTSLYDWGTFRADMISKYAEGNLVLFIRRNLAALKEGAGSVRSCYDQYRAIVLQADSHPGD